MASLGNSMGEGGNGGRRSDIFIDTGYGTHDGKGNVPTGNQYEKGTGYDEHGQVATSFGKWPLSYDPVTGMAMDRTTTGYDFPAGEGGRDDPNGGLADVSAPAPGHTTTAQPELRQQVEAFFASRTQAGQQAQQAGPRPHADVPEAGADRGEGEGQHGDDVRPEQS